MASSEFKYTVKTEVAVLGEPEGKAIGVNVISFGDKGKPKLDIRWWDYDMTPPQMKKGIGLTLEQAEDLLDVLNEYLGTVDENFDEK